MVESAKRANCEANKKKNKAKKPKRTKKKNEIKQRKIINKYQTKTKMRITLND